MIQVKVKGIPDLRNALREIPKKLRKRALRNALAAGARVIRDDARRSVPVLQEFVPYRRIGTVRKAINVRSSKIARRSGDVGVFVNVRPAKVANRGGKSPVDPFYWRFLEFGTKKMRAFPFLRPAADKLSQALEIFNKNIVPQIEKLNGGRNVTL